jgi:GT2 family glycosyltransferase
MLAVSVVVPTYNRSQSLARLLGGLDRQTVADFEVVVVDDGSSDDTLQMLARMRTRFGMRVLQQAHDGPAAARNLGVREARGRIILFLDDDVLPHPDLIREHMRMHEGSSDLVVVGPMSPPRDWKRPAWVRWEEDMLQVQYRDMLAGKYPCTPRQFYTANASVTRARLLQVGGFDAGYKRAEDVELAYRLRDAGARFVFDARASVLHYAARSFDAWLRIPHQYGRYDVAMHRDKGQETLVLAGFEFHTRNRLTRWVSRLCVGRPMLMRAAVFALRTAVLATDRADLQPLSRVVLSGLFNLLYWQGAHDELGGGRQALWQTVAAGARLDAKPGLVRDGVATVGHEAA